MPSVTFDRQSFSIGGRRRWIVAGAVDYTRLPRPSWRRAIADCRRAGVNTLLVTVPWRLHEPAPGVFDFSGDLDLPHFLGLLHEEGLLCALRPGPFIGAGWGAGALPPWLIRRSDIELRTASLPFLDAASKWIGALMKEVRALQLNANPGGPIALIQNEHNWFCGNPELGAKYLQELNRFLRENGAAVPVIDTNNLYFDIEGEIPAWSADDDLLATLRQLRTLGTDKPLIACPRIAPPPRSTQPSLAPAPREVVQRFAQILAAGGQPFIEGFHAGLFPPGAAARGVCPSDDASAALTASGWPTPALGALRPLLSFASSFERLFAHLSDEPPAVAAHPGRAATSVVHASGAQGDVAFVVTDLAASRGATVPLILPDGLALDVPVGALGVAWPVFNHRVSTHAVLDHCAFSPIAQIDETLVVFGPAGAEGEASVAGAAITLSAPKGKTPNVQSIEGVRFIVLSEEQAGGAFVEGGALVLGAHSLRDAGPAVLAPGAKQVLRVAPDGATTRLAATPLAVPSRAPALTGWASASCEAHIAGDHHRYAPIGPPHSPHSPQPLQLLSDHAGCAWLSVSVKSPSARKPNAAIFDAGGRAHLFLNGKPLALLGEGPDAQPPQGFTLPLKAGDNTLVFFLDDFGAREVESAASLRAGVFGDVWEAKPLKLAKPALREGAPLDPFETHAPIWRLHKGERTGAARLGWSVQHRRKSPLFVVIEEDTAAPRPRGLLVVNDVPLAYFDRAGRVAIRLDDEPFKRGKNTIEIALVDDSEDARRRITQLVSIYEGAVSITKGARWRLARWEPPAQADFAPVAKSAMKRAGAPTWWRASFTPPESEAPLLLDVNGLTKGAIFVNGADAARHFAATRNGKAIPPQRRYELPERLLKIGEPNELLVFDEFGAAPDKCRLVYDPAGPFGG